MKKQFTLSIIIPIHNSECFVETAIQSIVRQSMTGIELILIDDGSTDKSADICKQYISSSVRYFYIKNSGAGYARNKGILEAKGKWIIFLDSDDLILNGFLCDELFKYLDKEEKNETEIIYGAKIESDMKLLNKPKITYPESVEQIKKHYIPKIEFWSSIYRTDYLRSNKILFFEYKKQDIESAFRFRAFSRTPKIKVNPELVFIVHRNNPSSNVNTWCEYDMLEIKGLVYYKLFLEYEDKKSNTSIWLFSEYLHNLKLLLLLCYRTGFGKEGERQLIDLLYPLGQSIPNLSVFRLPLRDILLYYISKLIRKKFFWNIFSSLCIRKKCNIEIKEKSFPLMSDDLEIVLQNLDNYSVLVGLLKR